MKTIAFAGLILIFWLLSACKKDNSGVPDNRDTIKLNQAPTKPSNPSPYDGATDVQTNIFSWSASSDPDNDTIAYDIYIDTSNIPKLVVSNLSAPQCTLPKLVMGAKYYWKVVARDNHDSSSTSIIWSFSTKLTCIDFSGNKYQTVKIGTQTWMTENLKAKDSPTRELSPSYDYYNDNKEKLGLLYSYHTVMDGSISSNLNPSEVQGICPVGWHLPSDLEWNILIDYLGGDSLAGGKMKETGSCEHCDTLWAEPNINATNESGFHALPGDMFIRNEYGSIIYSSREITRFWSSTANLVLVNSKPIEMGHYIELNNFDGYVRKGIGSNEDQYSIRCVKN